MRNGTPSPPRVAPADSTGNLAASTRELLRSVSVRSGLAGTPAIYGTLVRHPALFERLLGSGLGRMPDALLSTRHRELVVLRTLRNCGAEYEWVHHVRHAPERGLSPDDVRLARDGSAGREPSVETALSDATDELHRDASISDPVWQRLASHLSAEQMLEAIVLVGYFHVFGYLVNACGVQLEAEVAAQCPDEWPLTAGAAT